MTAVRSTQYMSKQRNNMLCTKASLHGYSVVGNIQGVSKKIDNVPFTMLLYLYLRNRSELDTCSYKLHFTE